MNALLLIFVLIFEDELCGFCECDVVFIDRICQERLSWRKRVWNDGLSFYILSTCR